MIGSALRLAWRHRRDLHKLVFYVRTFGLAKALERIRADMRGVGGASDYATWVACHDTPTAADLAALRTLIEGLPARPVFSLVLSGGDASAAARARSLASLEAQVYPHWQLCEGGEAAAGDFVGLMAAGDVLAPQALALIAAEIAAHPETDIVYTDEDRLDAEGRRHAPRFKPDWDAELLLGQDYLNHLAVFRRGLVAPGAGCDAYDLALRAVERTVPQRIRHIPHVLYHASQPPTDGAAALRAVAGHLARTGSAAAVTAGLGGMPRVVHPLPDPAPLVSLLVPTRDGVELVRQCLDGLLHGTDYPALEVIILDNDSVQPDTIAYFREIAADPRVRVLPQPGPFNFSAINNAGVAAASGSIVGFINNDIKVIGPDWLREMVAHACRLEVGAVGAKLLYGDGTIQHGGVILGIGGVGAHAHRRFPADHPGDMGRLRLVQSFSAVTAACLMMRKALFDEVGGFDADHLAVAFNDVDLCLKLRARGYRVVWTPYAELYHLESVSRGGDLEAATRERFRAETLHMRRRWAAVLDADPFYNPNLTLHACDYGLAFPPRRPLTAARNGKEPGTIS